MMTVFVLLNNILIVFDDWTPSNLSFMTLGSKLGAITVVSNILIEKSDH